MKKFILLSFLILIIRTGSSQNLIVAITDAGGTATVTPIPNGATIDFTTSISSFSSTKVRILNNNANAGTYSVVRKRMVLNAKASTYFCFGQSCFDSTINTPPTSADYVYISPGAYNQGFQIDFEESTLSVGYSLVRYKLYNVNDANDTLTFYFKYNSILGVNNALSALESVSEIYPNPTSTNASIAFNLRSESELKIQLFNCLGEVVYGSNVKYAPGKHRLPIDCSTLTAGMYFMTLSEGENRLTKRLIVK